jgi:hypothetical protein
MVVDKSKGKKLVYVSEDIINGITEISKKKGTSVTKYIEDMLKQAIRVDGLNFSTEEMGNILEVIQVQRVLGGTFMPLDVLNYVSDQCFEKEKDEIRLKWFESGKIYGKYLKERFSSPLKTFQVLLKVMRWDLDEVEIAQNTSNVKIRCVSSSLNSEGTDLLAKFIAGATNGMGYNTEKIDCMKGMIIMELKALS